MARSEYTLSRESCYSVPVADVDKLLAGKDGSAALLYLHLLSRGFLDRSAAESLGLTGPQYDRGMNILRSSGLITDGNEKKLPPPAEIPEYRAEDIIIRSQEDSTFSAVVSEAQRLLGHILNSSELKILFGIYDFLSLPAEVILTLINHCIETTRERLGPGRTPTMRSIEKAAYIWSNRDIVTLDRAEKYLQNLAKRREASEQVKQALQIRGRELTATEQKYVDSWLEMGFGPDALAIAYDRTVVSTGSLQWKYMNSIVSSWHSKGLHTPEEIDRGDRRQNSSAQRSEQKPSGNTVSGSSDLDRMEKLLGLK